MSEEKKMYCVKCREMMTPISPKYEEITFKSRKTGKAGSRWGMSGQCPKCHIKAFMFTKKD